MRFTKLLRRLVPAVVGMLFANVALAELPNGLPDSFAKPDAWKWGQLKTANTGALRYGWSPATSGPGKRIAVLVAGAGSPIEKYWEITNDLNDQGYDVWQIDWPGHGLSDRLTDNPMMLHIEDFATYVAVLNQFVNKKVKPAAGERPLTLWANSMSGNIALRYLHDHPGVFKATVMSAPMFKINNGDTPMWAYRMIAGLGTLLGFDKDYVPGGGDWAYNPDVTMEELNSSWDPDRFDALEKIFRNDPRLVHSWPSIGWLNAAIDTTDLIFEDGYPEAIQDPFLVMSPQVDRWVIPSAHNDITDRTDKGDLLPLPGLMHEPWFDKPVVRQDLFVTVEGWMKAQGL